MKKRGFAVCTAILLVLLMCAGCKQSLNDTVDNTVDSGVGTISGKVTYQNAGIDSSGITVYLEKLEDSGRSAVVAASSSAGRAVSAPFYKETITASDGAYKFDELPDGSYTVYATRENEAAYRTVSVVDGGNVTAIDLQLVKRGSISGKLKVSSGGSVAGSIVGVAGTSYIAFVAEDGSFTITGIPVGTHKLCVMTNGVYQAIDAEYDVDGENPTDAGEISVSNNSYVTAKVTQEGLEFSGTILSNVSGFTYGENYDVVARASATISITDLERDVVMEYEWKKPSDNYYTWTLVYPLVEKGKIYKIWVNVAWKDYYFYGEYFELTAEGGLGEYYVENEDASIPELTLEKVMQKKTAPTFNANSKVKVVRQGTAYDIHTCDADDNYLSWVIAGDRWNDNSDGKYALKDTYQICGWKRWEQVNASLSGNRYGIEARTLLVLAGYSNVIFKMNDNKNTCGDWGGEKIKTLVVYGVRTADGKVLLTKGDFDVAKIQPTGMPGESHTITVGSETTTYLYSQLVDFATDVSEPKNLPSYSVAGTGTRFSGWSTVFPVSSYSGTQGKVDGKETWLSTPIYANFELIGKTYTVEFKLNDGSDKTYHTQKVSRADMGSNWNGDSYSFRFPEEPTRLGYKFTGWYTDKKSENMYWEWSGIPDEVLSSDKTTFTLYAGWEKLYTATFMDGETKIATETFTKGAKLTTVPDTKDGYLFGGWYADKACTEPVDTTTGKDITVYAAWIKVETWWTGNAESNVYPNIDSDNLYKLQPGDTLYFEVYNDSSQLDDDNNCYVAVCDANQEYYFGDCYAYIPAGQTTYVPLYVDSGMMIYSVKAYGLYVRINNSNMRLKGIYYAKGTETDSNEIVIFDPAKYKGKVGEVVELYGEKFLKVTPDGSNTQIAIDSVDLRGKDYVRCSIGVSDMLDRNELYLRLYLNNTSNDSITDLGGWVYPKADVLLPEKHENNIWHNEDDNVQAIQVLVQFPKDDWADLNDVPVYIGKITAF